MHNPVSGRNSLQAFQMLDRMNTHQLSERRQRRVMKLKKMIKPLRNQVIADRTQALRTFRMETAHVM